MRIPSGFAAIAAFGLLLPAVRADEPNTDDLRKLELQLKAAHQKVSPAVACVVVSRSDQYPPPAKTPEHPGQLGGFDRAEFLKAHPRDADLAARLDLSNADTVADHGFAGGVVIDPAGFVLVNYHTIDGATKVYVHLPGGKGSYADVRAADARSDLAVLRLLTPPADLKAVKFGPVRLPASPDDPKATVFPGKVLALVSYTYAGGRLAAEPGVGLGSVRGVRRLERPANAPLDARQNYYSYAPLIEYEAQSNPGCSGVALLDLDGAVVGLTAETATVAGGKTPALAMPADENFRRVVDVLRRGEEVEYGFLGVSRNQNLDGMVIDSITPGSPAFRAGLQTGDKITRIDGHPIRVFEDLLYYGGSALAGTRIRVAYQRRGQENTTTLTLAKFKADTPYIATVRPDPVFGLRVDFASILTPTVFTIGSVVPIPRAVAIRELVPGSPAEERFKALGENTRWAVTHVNGTEVLTPAEFYAAAKGQPSVRLTVIDPAEPRPRTVTLP
jgi:serine protease Do